MTYRQIMVKRKREDGLKMKSSNGFCPKKYWEKMMLEKVVNKLWQGKYVSVRDYEVRKAIKQGGMIIRHKDKHMKMSADELAKLKPNPKEIQSFYKGTYKLVDIEFEPYMADKRQMDFEDILKGL